MSADSSTAPEARPAIDALIGQSARMLALKAALARVAATDLSVLICGETGTGKELVARALHEGHSQRTGPFVAINCAAIPDTLLESELFGHEKGAFTGAFQQKPGKVELAHGGTLFLDEIGDMPVALQAKLLRFTEERAIERVGGTHSVPVDVRIVAATHQNVSAQILDGVFRQDLYYRLAEFTLTLAPLRQRGNDAVLIARALLRDYSAHRSDLPRPMRLAEDAIEAISAWHWPGNVRELENYLKRACLFCESGVITAADLELFDVAQTPDRLPLAAPPKLTSTKDEHHSSTYNLREVRRQAEQSAILSALELSDDNVSKAAQLLGVTRPTLYNLMDKYAIRLRSRSTPHVQR